MGASGIFTTFYYLGFGLCIDDFGVSGDFSLEEKTAGESSKIGGLYWRLVGWVFGGDTGGGRT